MNGRRDGGIFLIIFLLLFIALLQAYCLIRVGRFDSAVGRLEESLNSPAPGRFLRKQAVFSDTADEGDWLVWAFRVEPKTLNQISAENDIYARWITVPYVFEPLLCYNDDTMELEPWLAEKYEVSDDGLEITFHLRKDVFFSDGLPVTADDCLFTYRTIMNPKVDAANIANLYIDVDRAEKIDDRTVKFVMKRPYFKALENLSFWDIGILPEHIYRFNDAEQFNKRVSEPVGSGPYVFEKWETGRQVVLRRNENYWGQKPKLKKIIYKFIPNAAAAVQALRSHQVDIVIPEPEQFADLLGDIEFNRQFSCLSYWVPWTPFFYIGWNADTVFFADRRVRLAMTHIINCEQIVSQLLKGQGRIITGPFYIFGTQNDPNITPWPFDVEKAKLLLDEAGWTDTDGDGLRDKNGVPFRFKFTYAGSYTLYERLAKLLKDSAAKVGIDVVPEPLEWSVIIGRLNDRDFESVVMGLGGDILQDPYQLCHSSQIGGGGSNYVGFRDKQADEIIEQARRTLQRIERDRLYHRLDRILHEQQPYTFLFTRPTQRLVDKRFENVIIYKLGPKYWQWYVPKDKQRYK